MTRPVRRTAGCTPGPGGVPGLLRVHAAAPDSGAPRIDIQLYRRLTFGDLVDVYMLDTRQDRSDQNQELRLDPTRTILGDEQEQGDVDQ